MMSAPPALSNKSRQLKVSSSHCDGSGYRVLDATTGQLLASYQATTPFRGRWLAIVPSRAAFRCLRFLRPGISTSSMQNRSEANRKSEGLENRYTAQPRVGTEVATKVGNPR